MDGESDTFPVTMSFWKAELDAMISQTTSHSVYRC